jgi:hypothetical protein
MPRTCFVIGPIGDEGSAIRGHADWLLDEIITPVFSEHFKEFEVVRSDRISSPGMIDSQVINYTLDAELVIADLSFQNPNVFYEMGLRHREQKPIIHMFLAGQELPFDVKPYRAIPFSLQHPKQLTAAKDLLRKAVEAVLDKHYKVENPVTRARGFAEISKHAMSAQELILAEIESLRREVQAAAMTAASAQSVAGLALGPSSRSLASGLAPFLQTEGLGNAAAPDATGAGVTLGSGDFRRRVSNVTVSSVQPKIPKKPK